MEKPCVEGDAACQEAVWPVERWPELSMEELTDLGGSSGGRDEGGLLLPETPREPSACLPSAPPPGLALGRV